MLEVAFPARRIFARPKAADLGPIENALDPTTHASSRHRVLIPKPLTLEQAMHCRRIDLIHRRVANARNNVVVERLPPLNAALGVAPGRLLSRDVLLGRLAEGDRGRPGRTIEANLLAVDQPAPQLSRLFARLVGRDRVQRPKPELSFLAAGDVAKHPRGGAARHQLYVKLAAIAD